MRGKEDNFDDGMGAVMMGGGGNVRVRQRPSNTVTLYFDKPIGDLEDYRDVIEALESATPWDDVKAIIVNGGGDMMTGITLMDYIKNCESPVTAYLHERCASMATALALTCENWVVGEFANFMIHSATFGIYGKTHEVDAEHAFTQAQIERFVTRTYSGFLTPKEIKQVLAGKDFWFDTPELRERLSNFARYRANERLRAQKEAEKERKRQIKEEKQNASIIAAESLS